MGARNASARPACARVVSMTMSHTDRTIEERVRVSPARCRNTRYRERRKNDVGGHTHILCFCIIYAPTRERLKPQHDSDDTLDTRRRSGGDSECRAESGDPIAEITERCFGVRPAFAGARFSEVLTFETDFKESASQSTLTQGAPHSHRAPLLCLWTTARLPER